MLDTAEEKSLYEDGLAKRTAYVNLRTAILKLKTDGQPEQAAQLTDEKLVPALQAYDASIRNMSLHQKANIDQAVLSIDALYRSGRLSLMVLAVDLPGVGRVAVVALDGRHHRPLARSRQAGRDSRCRRPQQPYSRFRARMKPAS